MRVRGAQLWSVSHEGDEQLIKTVEERDVFRVLGLQWVEPEKRFGGGDLKKETR